jgi:excinuclease ABC subunit C
MTLEQYNQINIPKKPGVYFWKKGDQILYIGKATNLSHRTRSYLQKTLMETRGPLVVKMVEDSETIEYTETESVLEALILESYLIKRHQPEYNSKEKDDKSYNYVVITDEVLPRVFTVRQRTLKIIEGKRDEKLLYTFGPFPQRDQLETALKIIRKIFPFHGKKTQHKHNSEFYKQIGYLPNTDDNHALVKYRQTIDYIALFFQGKKRSIVRELNTQMMQSAKKLDFEHAGEIKKQLYALEHIRDIALMKHDFELSSYINSFRIEAYDIAHLQGDDMVGVMVVYNGREIDSSDHRVFNIKGFTSSNDTGALYETITRRLSHKEWPYPNIIVVDGGIAQKRIIEKSLRELGLEIPVMSVVKDDKHKAREILGQKKISQKYHREILSLNAESHRFAIKKHKEMRSKNFLDTNN